MPKRHPRVPKSHPRGVWEMPESLQNPFRNGSGPNFRTLLAEICVEEAAGPILARFLYRARDGHFAPMCVSYHSCQCFARVGASTPRQCRSMPNHGETCENKVLEAPKPSREPPGPFRNRAQSAPRRTKNDHERPTAQQEAQNAPKKRPRATNNANMAPKWVGKVQDLGFPGRGWTPPKVLRSD